MGALIDGKPTELHDAVENLLGLGLLKDAKDRLRVARKELTDQARDVADVRKQLRAVLSGVDDPRAARAA